MIVVSNSTILIGLSKIGKLDLLQKLFTKIVIPAEVFDEVVGKGENKPGADDVKNASWIETSSISDRIQVQLLMGSLDKGEAEAVVLAKEKGANLILLDEEKARKMAVLAGFKVMGVLGVLLLAKKLGIITAVKPYIQKLQQKKFRIGDKVVVRALREAGEKP